MISSQNTSPPHSTEGLPHSPPVRMSLVKPERSDQLSKLTAPRKRTSSRLTSRATAIPTTRITSMARKLGKNALNRRNSAFIGSIIRLRKSSIAHLLWLFPVPHQVVLLVLELHAQSLDLRFRFRLPHVPGRQDERGGLADVQRGHRLDQVFGGQLAAVEGERVVIDQARPQAERKAELVVGQGAQPL